ncbi:hypothetical protein VNI00_002444 [Paramarasmius palmivorus]|uniref:Uncharacterized protein n=1 Tax=Paramarasmius palmivorus TaxID=297713 RepID=A0AAW0DYL9_9AGAR
MYLLNSYPPRKGLFLVGMQMHLVCLSTIISKAFVLPVLHIINVKESPAKTTETSPGIMATTVTVLVVLHLFNPIFNDVVRSDENQAFNFGALFSSVVLVSMLATLEGFGLLSVGFFRFFKAVFSGDLEGGVRMLMNVKIELMHEVKLFSWAAHQTLQRERKE